MDNRTFAGLLAATPPADLSILELTAELTRPDGSFDLDAAAARQGEVESGLRPGAGLRGGHGAATGGAAMAAAAPAQLSGLANCSCGVRRRCGSWSRWSDTPTTTHGSRGWCAASFPRRRRRRFRPPTYARGWSASYNSFRSVTSPSTLRSSSSSWTRGTNPPGPGCERASPSS